MLDSEDKEWILEKFQEHSRSFREQLEKVETTLLTEFHKWASPFEARQRSHTSELYALHTEIQALSDRLKKLESRS